MRKLHLLSLFVLFAAVCAFGTEVGPNQGFNRKVSFDNYDQGVSYSITASPQSGWHFIDSDTRTHNNWKLRTHSSSVANASVSVDGSLGSPDFFGLALDGYMVPDTTEGDGVLEKKYWSITADLFLIHSDSEYSKVISPYGQNVTFTAVGGKDPITWSVTKVDPGDGNIPTLPSGRALTIGAIGADGINPVTPGTYTIIATDSGDLTDSMTLVVIKVEKIQYTIVSGDYKDFNGVQKILYGKEAHLKAIVYPDIIDLPENFPQWMGTFGVTDMGVEVSHTYSGTPSTNDTDTKTVMTEAGPDSPEDFLVCKIVLGIHSNVEPNAGFTDGHAWISVTDFSSGSPSTITYGLWGNIPRDNPNTDMHINREPSTGKHNRYYLLSPSEVTVLNTFILSPESWTIFFTCADWSENAVETVAGETVSAQDYVLFGTPRAIAGSIVSLESSHPTNQDKPLNGGEEASSTTPGESWDGSSFP